MRWSIPARVGEPLIDSQLQAREDFRARNWPDAPCDSTATPARPGQTTASRILQQPPHILLTNYVMLEYLSRAGVSVMTFLTGISVPSNLPGLVAISTRVSSWDAPAAVRRPTLATGERALDSIAWTRQGTRGRRRG